VLSTCSSLLAVVDVGVSPVVQFAHFSVKEYLTSERLAKAKDTISRFHVSMTPAHTILAQACLGVLLQLDENVTRESVENFPLSKYAARHWVDHARFENVASIVHDGVKRLFDPSKGHLSAWVWIHDPGNFPSQYGQRSHERPPKLRATPLYYASACGMHDIARFLIIEHSQDVNAQDSYRGETPLHMASRWAHMEVVRVLLKFGADTEARDYDQDSPLHVASQCGDVELARALLEHNADTEALGGYNRTPLLLASREGHVELARVLLKHDADTDTRDHNGYNAMEYAMQMGHVEVALLLVEHGADVTAPGDDGKTSLYWALKWEKLAVVQALLRHGADAKALCNFTNNRTLLHCARGEEDARLLLEHGADANALDIDNLTPLHLASVDGRVGAARVLL